MTWNKLVQKLEQLDEALSLPTVPSVYSPLNRPTTVEVNPEINIQLQKQQQSQMPQTQQEPPDQTNVVQSKIPTTSSPATNYAPGSLVQQLQQINPNASPEFLALAPAFEDAGKKYNIDPRFLASVAAVETGWGSSRAFRQGKNVMGISNNQGPLGGFGAHEHSIYKQAASLAGAPGTAGHYAKANTISDIARIYAPPGASNDPRKTNSQWPSLVGGIYSKLGGDPNSPVK